MAKLLIFFILTFVSFNRTYGQRLGDYYVAISMDSIQGGRLKFLNDTTVELSSIPRHMSPSLKTIYKYVSTDTTIEILPSKITNKDATSTGIYVQPVLKTKLMLTKFDRGFIDYSKSLIYVRQKDFPANPEVAYVIDGKTYMQDAGVADGYGLIKKSPKTNKSLQKRLKTIDKDNCTIEIVRGLAAYKRFGIDKVYGVIVFTTKK